MPALGAGGAAEALSDVIVDVEACLKLVTEGGYRD